MTGEAEIERALAAIAAALNDERIEELDPERVQGVATEAAGRDPALTVDSGGGLHDPSGARVGAIRRTDSGEWIVDRQNPDAPHAGAPVPPPPD
jgi:hypothetical protein